MSDVECFSEATENVMGVASIFPCGGSKYRFQNFGKCNLGEFSIADLKITGLRSDN